MRSTLSRAINRLRNASLTVSSKLAGLASRGGSLARSTRCCGKNGDAGAKFDFEKVYDVTKMPPQHIADVPLFKDPSETPKPGWISFSIDGKYAYPDGGAVIDTKTKQVAARIPTSEKLIEIDFQNGKVIKAGHR